MTRLIVCDLDGTLMPQGERTVRRALLSKIEARIRKGTLFCVASGRPYEELYPLFGALARDIIFICLDGALVMHRNCVLYKKPLCKIEAARLLSLSRKGKAYGRGKALSFSDEPSERVREKLNSLGSEVFKVSLFGERPDSSVARRCYDRGGIADYVANDADKSVALLKVCQKFGVDTADTAALGDGENDERMLSVVGKPYRMEKSAAALVNRGYPSVGNVADWLERV